ncbi:hypothetical protein FX985_03226 [Pseudomonas extremaustralis]|uniref:Uncharacterized protein n=1 Tax=Pseudomonas extremaustralis TaxID=359110 RepID=A0A5M9J292_9PSED|nr:hypothetical protein FX985_03226 [Pseudomonas extremaustralis]
MGIQSMNVPLSHELIFPSPFFPISSRLHPRRNNQ